MHLTRIQVEHIGPVDRIDFDLTHPVTREALSPIVLYGVNGSGKTTLLRAITNALLGQTLIGRRGVSSSSLSLAARITELESGMLQSTVGAEVSLDVTVRLNEHGRWHTKSTGDLRKVIEIVSDWQESFPFLFMPSQRRMGTKAVRSVGEPSSYDHAGAKTAVDRFEGLKQLIVNEHNKWAIQQVKAKQFLTTRVMHELWTEFERFIAPKMFDEVSEDREVWFKDPTDGSRFTIDELSSGEQSLLIFLLECRLWRDSTTLVLIDEIDAHLHVAWQMEILPALQRLLPDAQIICTTHQPLVLESVPEENRFRLPSPGEQPTEQAGAKEETKA